MNFERARTTLQINSRIKEILDCAIDIYQTQGLEKINFLEISKTTNFTRPTIYKYFKTKEEILLKMILIYTENFLKYIENNFKETLSDIDVANILTDAFIEIPEFMDLYTILHSTIEKNVSVEALSEFKKDIHKLQASLLELLKRVYTKASKEDLNDFFIFYISFSAGLYPMTKISNTQKEAIKHSNVPSISNKFSEIFRKNLLVHLRLLQK